MLVPLLYPPGFFCACLGCTSAIRLIEVNFWLQISQWVDMGAHCPFCIPQVSYFYLPGPRTPRDIFHLLIKYVEKMARREKCGKTPLCTATSAGSNNISMFRLIFHLIVE